MNGMKATVAAVARPAVGEPQGDDPSLDEIQASLLKLASTAQSPSTRKALERAARALFQSTPSGRAPVSPEKDRESISQALAMYASGEAPSLWAARLKVAAARYGDENPESAAERLRRRRSAEKNRPRNN